MRVSGWIYSKQMFLKNRFKTRHRPVLMFEEKKQSITHLFKTFSGLRLGCNAFILAKRSENTVNWTFLKINAILNARFRVSYFKLKVNGRAVTSQTDKQPIVEVGSVCVCTGQPTWTNFHFDSPGMKLLFSSWALLFHPFRALLCA